MTQFDRRNPKGTCLLWMACSLLLVVSGPVVCSSGAQEAALADQVLEVLSEEQLESFMDGTPAESLVLGTGETLAEHLAVMAAGAGGEPLVLVTIDSCSLLRTPLSTDGKMANTPSLMVPNSRNHPPLALGASVPITKLMVYSVFGAYCTSVRWMVASNVAKEPSAPVGSSMYPPTPSIAALISPLTISKS